MKILLDTHYLVWASAEQTRLTAVETRLLEGDPSRLYCSAVSLWELRLKWSRQHRSGERKGPIAPHVALSFMEASEWTMLPLTMAHAVTSLDTALDHGDPFDELLLVQAQVEGLRLLTRDARLREHPLAYAV